MFHFQKTNQTLDCLRAAARIYLNLLSNFERCRFGLYIVFYRSKKLK